MTPIIPTAQELRDQMPKFDGVTDFIAIQQLVEIHKLIEEAQESPIPVGGIDYADELHPEALAYLERDGYWVWSHWSWKEMDFPHILTRGLADYIILGNTTLGWVGEKPEDVQPPLFSSRALCKEDAERARDERQAGYDKEWREKEIQKHVEQSKKPTPAAISGDDPAHYNPYGCLPLLLIFALPAVYLLFS